MPPVPVAPERRRADPVGSAAVPASFVLVLGAATLLFLGMWGEERRALIWTSLGVAVLAVALLTLAVLRRRGEGRVESAEQIVPPIAWPLPAGDPPPISAPLVEQPASGSVAESTYGAPSAGTGGAGAQGPVPDDAGPVSDGVRDPRDPADEPGIELGGSATGTAELTTAELARIAELSVVVVDGRPRFHLASCPVAAGRVAVSIPLGEAWESGFTPCAACRPVAALRSAGGVAQPPV